MQRWLVVLAIVALAVLAMRHAAPAPAIATAEPAARAVPSFAERRAPRAAVPEPALVYVVGAVPRPGLYRIADGARIDDAVRAAGGLRPDADPAGVNLAARASDGDEIIVPVLGQSIRPQPNTKRTRSRAPRSRASKTRGVVDVNTALAPALASVPGIGATIAARIVQVREEEGTFTTFDQLLDVAGLTESRLERARPYLKL